MLHLGFRALLASTASGVDTRAEAVLNGTRAFVHPAGCTAVGQAKRLLDAVRCLGWAGGVCYHTFLNRRFHGALGVEVGMRIRWVAARSRIGGGVSLGEAPRLQGEPLLREMWWYMCRTVHLPQHPRGSKHGRETGRFGTGRGQCWCSWSWTCWQRRLSLSTTTSCRARPRTRLVWCRQCRRLRRQSSSGLVSTVGCDGATCCGPQSPSHW